VLAKIQEHVHIVEDKLALLFELAKKEIATADPELMISLKDAKVHGHHIPEELTLALVVAHKMNQPFQRLPGIPEKVLALRWALEATFIDVPNYLTMLPATYPTALMNMIREAARKRLDSIIELHEAQRHAECLEELACLLGTFKTTPFDSPDDIRARAIEIGTNILAGQCDFGTYITAAFSLGVKWVARWNQSGRHVVAGKALLLDLHQLESILPTEARDAVEIALLAFLGECLEKQQHLA
jgi:hypothetical protein